MLSIIFDFNESTAHHPLLDPTRLPTSSNLEKRLERPLPPSLCRGCRERKRAQAAGSHNLVSLITGLYCVCSCRPKGAGSSLLNKARRENRLYIDCIVMEDEKTKIVSNFLKQAISSISLYIIMYLWSVPGPGRCPPRQDEGPARGTRAEGSWEKISLQIWLIFYSFGIKIISIDYFSRVFAFKKYTSHSAHTLFTGGAGGWLGWNGFSCSTLCLGLLGLMRLWLNRPGNWAKWWNL